jgi:hypothetical protein
MTEYAERDPRDLGEHYIKHVSAMTGEGLHSKAAIAAELAYRDSEIERLRFSCSELSRDALDATFEIERLRSENERLIAFCRDISEQVPEQPDYWSSCSQCAKNIDTAEDMLEALKPDSEAE